MFPVLLALLVAFVIAGCLLALLAALGWSMPVDMDKVREARAWSAQRRELNASVEARRVKS